MNRRLFTILISAFVIAALCAFVVYRIVSRRMSVSPVAKVTRVVAAAANIPLGSILQSKDLSSIEIAGPLPKGVLLKPQDAIGRGVIAALYAGEPIIDSRLAPPGSGGGLAATIPTGMRAVAVKVDQIIGVAGFVTPGMRVDVLISGLPPGMNANTDPGTITKTLLQNIEVLSAGTDIQKDATGKPKQVTVVNLLVTPEQAQQLSLAGAQTRIQLVLRNPLDTQIAKPAETSVAQLFAGSKNAPAPKHYRRVRRAPTTYQVQVFNGAKKSEAKFPVGEEKQ
ncbi:MAG TPA: Flp pilus assembly protein CpaB [Acidobacteriaceae bacterium]|nr:Flp pilus assembly protein CpaB [Acidobacteriaceae bacterium]